MYLIAIIFPPIAVLLCGKPFQAVINIFLCLFFYIPGLIHAILVVNEYKADKRAKKHVLEKPLKERTGTTPSSTGTYANVFSKTPSNPIDEIERLGELKEKGLITEEEFRAKKKQILGI